MKATRLFVYGAGVFLLITSTAKVISGFGHQAILKMHDPVLGLSFRNLFFAAASVEVMVALICFFDKRTWLASLLVAWLATNLLFYRVGMVLAGYHRPCNCLGTLTDMLHIPPQTADTAMKSILAYLLVGSYATLFWLWRQNKRAKGRIKNEEVKPESGVAG